MVAAYHGRHILVQQLLDSKCDPFIKDSCGEMAVHHAVKEEHYFVVKALVTKQEPAYFEESGLALSVFDIAMQKLIGDFPLHRLERNNSSEKDLEIKTERKFIYNHLLKVQTNARVLASTDDVVQVTNLMIDCALEQQSPETIKRGRRRRVYSNKKRKNTQSDDMNANYIITKDSYDLTLPELPAIDPTFTVEMKDEIEGEAPDSFEGMTIAISGTFPAMTHEDIIKLIKKNGGTYSSSLSQSVTHLLVADPDETSYKITKAKNDGKKIVGEEFLSNVRSKKTATPKKK